MSRGQIQAVRDPAVAIAMSKCWLARSVSRWPLPQSRGSAFMLDSFHPEQCIYCPDSEDYLIAAINEFNEWSGVRMDDAVVRSGVEGFLALSQSEQARLVKQAQYVDTDAT